MCFFSFFENNGKKLAAQLDWVLICSVAVLPTVGFLWIAYLRRERALDELAKGAPAAVFLPVVSVCCWSVAENHWPTQSALQPKC